MNDEILIVSENIKSFIGNISFNKSEHSVEIEIDIINAIIQELKDEIKQTKPIIIDNIDVNILLDNLTKQDINKLREKPQFLQKFYKQNIKVLILFLEELILNFNEIEEERLKKYRLETISDLLLQYMQFKQFHEFIANNRNLQLSSGMTMREHDISKHLKLSAILFNNCCFSPRELIPASITEIRQLIETKIRYSFKLNFIAMIKNDNLSIPPINMKIFFDFISTNDSIEIKEFNLVQKIYSWTNNYIHTGEFSYYWQIWYATRKLNCFAKNCKNINGKFENDSPILIHDLETVQNEFKNYLEENLKADEVQCIYYK